MKILKHSLAILFVLLCTAAHTYAAPFDGVRELVSRRAPWLGKHIQGNVLFGRRLLHTANSK
jgi:alpha-N-acetylglucosaminidase